MRRKSFITAMIAVLLLISVSIAFAGHWKGWRESVGRGMVSRYNRMYNPAAIGAISGTVEAVDTMAP